MANKAEKPLWWEEAVCALSANDPVLKRVIEQNPDVHLISRGSPFETLLRSVIGQQISVKAAEHIWERFSTACPTLTPAAVSRKHRRTLRAAGLSERKVDFVLDICRFFSENPDWERDMHELSDEALIQALCSVKGVGRWTAEMFLIFALLRPNVAPLLDLGFMKALERLYFAEGALENMSPAEKREAIQSVLARWEPWKTAAAWYLWRSLNNAPVQY